MILNAYQNILYFHYNDEETKRSVFLVVSSRWKVLIFYWYKIYFGYLAQESENQLLMSSNPAIARSI